MLHLLRTLVIGWFCCGLLGAAYVVNTVVPTGPDRIAGQLAFLDEAIADGAPERMQQLFPEGEMFTHLLPALAAGNLARGDTGQQAAALGTLDTAIAALDSEQVRAPFGEIDALAHGTFYRGWMLLLRVTRAEVAGEVPPELVAEADEIVRALAASPTGVVDSYPGQFWPCDAVVAMAAVRRTHAAVGRDTPELAGWLAALDRLRDPDSGLLPHRIDATGDVLDPPRATSLSIIHTFWPELSPTAAEDWASFRARYVTREAGLVGIREHPHGVDGSGDVDSGELVLGVSLSATAVSVGAARANGDVELAATLDREAELLGLPLPWGQTRRFALGLLPVGDAFVVWARSIPAAAPAAGLPGVPVPWLTVLVALVLIAPLGLAPWAYAKGLRRAHSPG